MGPRGLPGMARWFDDNRTGGAPVDFNFRPTSAAAWTPSS